MVTSDNVGAHSPLIITTSMTTSYDDVVIDIGQHRGVSRQQRVTIMIIITSMVIIIINYHNKK